MTLDIPERLYKLVWAAVCGASLGLTLIFAGVRGDGVAAQSAEPVAVNPVVQQELDAVRRENIKMLQIIAELDREHPILRTVRGSGE